MKRLSALLLLGALACSWAVGCKEERPRPSPGATKTSAAKRPAANAPAANEDAIQKIVMAVAQGNRARVTVRPHDYAQHERSGTQRKVLVVAVTFGDTGEMEKVLFLDGTVTITVPAKNFRKALVAGAPIEIVKP